MRCRIFIDDLDNFQRSIDLDSEDVLHMTVEQIIDDFCNEKRIKDKVQDFCRDKNLSISKGVKYFICPDLLPKPPPKPPKPPSLNIPTIYWRR